MSPSRENNFWFYKKNNETWAHFSEQVTKYDGVLGALNATCKGIQIGPGHWHGWMH